MIKEENQKLGSDDWQLTRVRLDKRNGFRSPWIEGYCSAQSVRMGDSLDIMVSTNPSANFVIEIFRTGYYGGKGARLMTTLGPFTGTAQPIPMPDEKLLIECCWKPVTTLVIPDDWPSGVYLGRLTTVDDPIDYWQSYIIFIVCDDRSADILFQCSDNTWQAYNRWPNDYSLYTHPRFTRSQEYTEHEASVSFDRPYGKYAQIFENPQSVGSGSWLCFEFPMAYWLEQQGYDVTYCSNSDMVEPRTNCNTFLSVGHDEYWDLRQYESVIHMRDAGVNVMFFSGNSVCWVTPFSPSTDGRAGRIITRAYGYGGENKWAKMRDEVRGPFEGVGPDEGYLIGARNVVPVNGGGDWIVTKPEHWMFEGSGMKEGDRVPGLVGWEYHGDPPGDLPGLEVVAKGTALKGGVEPSNWAATIYPGSKDNFVFNAATIFWCQGLSSPPGHMPVWSHWSRPHGPDERVQRITNNLLWQAIKNRKMYG